MGGKHEGDKPSSKPVEPIKPSGDGARPDKGGKHEKGK
jgi:hypothetical protein